MEDRQAIVVSKLISADTIREEVARLRRENDQAQLLGSPEHLRQVAAVAMERMRRAEDLAEEATRLADMSDRLCGAALGALGGLIEEIGAEWPDEWNASVYETAMNVLRKAEGD